MQSASLLLYLYHYCHLFTRRKTINTALLLCFICLKNVDIFLNPFILSCVSGFSQSSSPSCSNINLFGSTSGIQQTSNSSVFGTITSSPFGSSTSFGGPHVFNAATNATSGQTQTYLWARPLYRHLERNMTLIVWPMNLWCGPGMSMSQTPPFLDIKELSCIWCSKQLTLWPPKI
ncbi:uncharacterized protein LOC129873714 [Solanum dulcamara]|uniref:uncharacterized protein LOC129873714 n=1 Tax=Solanum dulcamara TaxID=45834 RepID=UPI002486B069|nr:uncharacterized protein LOC129873714 [Solanum dulcamara]